MKHSTRLSAGLLAAPMAWLLLGAAAAAAPVGVPDVQVPTPPPPKLPAPPQVNLPRLPATPTAPKPPSPPGVTVPGAGSGGGGGGGPTSRGTTGSAIGQAGNSITGNGATGASGGAGGSGQGTNSRQTAQGRARARRRAFRRNVKRLQPCFYALPEFDQRVLVMRAGLNGAPARSRAFVARRLHVSSGRVRRAEQKGLSLLRATNSSDGCAPAPSSAPGEPPAPATFVFAPTPPLEAMAATAAAAGQRARRSAPAGSPARAGVMGTQASGGSGGEPLKAGAGLTLDPDSGGGDSGLLAALITALALALAAGVAIVRRRRVLATALGSLEERPAEAEAPQVAAEAPPAEPAPEDGPKSDGDQAWGAVPAAPWAPDAKEPQGDSSPADSSRRGREHHQRLRSRLRRPR